jgi:hypothetical protein
MSTTKTETLTVRLSPEIKAQLRQAAAQEHRSLANMVAVMVRYWVETADPSGVPRRQGARVSAPSDD